MLDEIDNGTDSTGRMPYEIRIEGHLGPGWTDWFGDVTVTLEEDGRTLLACAALDQPALYGLLRKVRDLGMALVSVMRVEPGPRELSEIKGNNSSISPNEGAEDGDKRKDYCNQRSKNDTLDPVDICNA